MQTLNGHAQRLEADWLAALHHHTVAQYLEKHFDDKAPDRGMAQEHSPGEAYASEVACTWTPAPLCEQPSLHQRYQAQLDKSPTDQDAWMWHALLGNQHELKNGVADYLLSNRNDKLLDLSAALFTSLQEGEKVHPALAKYTWLTRARFTTSSLLITQAWTSLIGNTAAAGSLAGASSKLRQRLTASLMVGRTVALAGQSAIESSALRRPLLVDIELDLKQARDIMEKRRVAGADALSNSQLKRMANRSGHIKLQLATDTVEARAAGLRAQDLAAAGVGSVSMGAAARAALAAAPNGVLRVNEEVFAKLLQSSATWQKRALDLTHELGRAAPSVSLTLNGQIGLLGMWINGFGCLSNAEKVINTKGEDALHLFNTFDAIFGTVSGASMVAEAAWGASLTHRLGAQAARGAVSIAALQAIGSVAGAASGLSVTVGQGIKATRALNAGDTSVAIAYGLSATTALGFTAASGIVAWGAVAGLMNKRLGTQGALWRGAARARLANMAVKRAGTAVGGAALGIPGWGVILLGLTLVGEVVAVMLTPSAQQEFIRRTRFGIGPTRYATLDEEFAAIEALGQGINPADAEREARRPQSISELGAMP